MILRLDPSASTFTTRHLSLARAAYSTGCIEPSLRVIDRDVTSFTSTILGKAGPRLCDLEQPVAQWMSRASGMADDVRSEHILEYEYLCGLIHASRRDWNKSQTAFQRAITHPTKDRGVSKISVNAYKRWLLVGLLGNGSEPVLPSYTPPLVKNACQSIAPVYDSITKLFSSPASGQLRAEIEANEATWQDDGTSSLVTEVLWAYQKWQIINLRRVYSRMSIEQLRAATSSPEAGDTFSDDGTLIQLIESMISTGMLAGQIDTDDQSGIVYITFNEEGSQMTEQDFARELAQSHHKIQTLAQEYNAVKDSLAFTSCGSCVQNASTYVQLSRLTAKLPASIFLGS